ncbi:MAG TPA: HD domain-containing protein [Bacteroidales bacterium]|nr:HD domain-containing protein [Bacteroidales bacterium]
MQHTFLSAAEAKHRPALMILCRKLFESAPMPSHDHMHHARVWENAKVLLARLNDAGMISDPLIAEKAIIAAFLHDTGLTVNREPDHGIQSRQICSKFLMATDLSEADREEILDAVEKHDDKEYPGASDPATLAAVISTADDMDAFGCEGISRYAEIYLLRGVPQGELPGKVIANAESRFRHLEMTYSIFPDLIEAEKKRVEKLITYYKNFIP